METVKMPALVQTKAGTVSRNASTGPSDQSQSFVKLLQEKKDLTETKTQPETAERKSNQVQGKDKKTAKTSETDQTPKDKVPDNAEEPDAVENVIQEAILQAGMQQAAAQMTAQMTGMLTEDVQQAAEIALDDVVLEVNVQTEDGFEIQNVQTTATDGLRFWAEDEMVASQTEGGRQANQVEDSAAAESGKVIEAESGPKQRTASSEKTSELRQTGEHEQIVRTEKDSVEPARQEKGEQNGSLEQGAGQFAAQTAVKDSTPEESQRNTKVSTADPQVQQDRKTEQEPVYHLDSVREQPRQQFFSEKTEQIPLRTSESQLPQDLGKTLAAKLPGNGQELVIELEPAALGKLTIKLAYEGGRAAVSILASNPRTLDMLSEKASEIAVILEEKTGQQTIIYTHAPQQQEEQDPQQNPGNSRQEQGQEQQRQHKEDQHQAESFAQQLRLGLI